jgi:hypothetical protein
MSQDEHDGTDERDAALDDRYRRASAADAGRPSHATRAAILARAAEQARQARRAVPAANDARLAWRAAAGVAVMGVAVLLWRQAEWHPPGQPQAVNLTQVAPEVAESGARLSDARASAQAEAALQAELPARAAEPAPAPAPARALAPPAAPPARAPAAEAASEASSASRDFADSGVPAESRQSALRVSPALSQGARAEALRERAEDRLQAGAGAPSRAALLLREQFPALAGRDSPATAWLVLDGEGAVVRKGELPAGLTLDEQARRLAASPDALQFDTWRTEVVTNEAGQPVTVATAVLTR